jgi:hypothetical protein
MSRIRFPGRAILRRIWPDSQSNDPARIRGSEATSNQPSRLHEVARRILHRLFVINDRNQLGGSVHRHSPSRCVCFEPQNALPESKIRRTGSLSISVFVGVPAGVNSLRLSDHSKWGALLACPGSRNIGSTVPLEASPPPVAMIRKVLGDGVEGSRLCSIVSSLFRRLMGRTDLQSHSYRSAIIGSTFIAFRAGT